MATLNKEQQRQIGYVKRAVPGLTANEQRILETYLLDPGYTDLGFIATYQSFASFKARYPAYEYLVANGQVGDEGQYRAMEREYSKLIDYYKMPAAYKDPAKLAQFMVNDVSPDEVDARLQQANQLLQTAPAAYKSALRDLYGISDGDALAFLVDPKGAKPLLDKRADEMIRATTLATRAKEYGIDLSKDEVAGLSARVADQYVPYSRGYMGTVGALQNDADITQKMQAAGIMSKEDAFLASVDQQSYDSFDAVQAAFGDQQKALASQQRRAREKARFSGSSGVGSGSLSQARNL